MSMTRSASPIASSLRCSPFTTASWQKLLLPARPEPLLPLLHPAKRVNLDLNKKAPRGGPLLLPLEPQVSELKDSEVILASTLFARTSQKPRSLVDWQEL